MLRDLFSLFPAYAGVILGCNCFPQQAHAFPRICGGDPLVWGEVTQEQRFSPHMRG